jgi:hypothetical protein
MSRVDADALANEIARDLRHNDPTSVVCFFDISWLMKNRERCEYLLSSRFASLINVMP